MHLFRGVLHRRMLLPGIAMLAYLVLLSSFASGADEVKTITVTVDPGTSEEQNVGCGFTLVERLDTELIVNLQSVSGTIVASELVSTAPNQSWTKTTGSETQWKLTGVAPNEPFWCVIKVRVVYTPQHGASGSPWRWMSVSDTDLDGDTDNNSTGAHRPPSESDSEDLKEYPNGPSDTVIGLLIPINDDNDATWVTRDGDSTMNYTADLDVLNMALKIDPKKSGRAIYICGHAYLYDDAGVEHLLSGFDNTVARNNFPPKALRVEGWSSSPSGTVDQMEVYFAPDAPSGGYNPRDILRYLLIGTDIDVDSDNSGGATPIENTNEYCLGEDFYEAHPLTAYAPPELRTGMLLAVNDDDDDGSGEPDNGWNGTDWDGPEADAIEEDENDLKPMVLRRLGITDVQRAAIEAMGAGPAIFLSKVGGTGAVRIWTYENGGDPDDCKVVGVFDANDGTSALPEGAFGLSGQNATLWKALAGDCAVDREFRIEGLRSGEVLLQVEMWITYPYDPVLVHKDVVRIAVITAGISCDVDMNNAIDYDDETRETTPGALVMVNNNDSDHDGTIDSADGRIPTGENELKQVTLTNLLPEELREKGRIRLRRTSGDFAVYSDRRKGVDADYDKAVLRGTYSANVEDNGQKTWDLENTQQRASFAALVTSGLYVEGLTATSSASPPRLRLLYIPTGSATELELDWIVVNVAQCEVMQDTNDNHNPADDNAVSNLNIGHWGKDGAGGTLTGYNGNDVRNTADPDNCVEEDNDRFYLRITAPWANVNTGAADTLAYIYIGTYTGFGAATPTMDDGFTQQTNVTETGADTGIFVSSTHLLCSPDLPGADDPDDDYAAGVFAADDVNNDRTHRASIDGALAVDIRIGEASARYELPVCDRATEYRRVADVRMHVFREPFTDVGYDHDNNPGTPNVGAGNGVFDYTDINGNGQHDPGEPSEFFRDISVDGIRNTVLGSEQDAATHVAAQSSRSNIAWAQAGITVAQDGNILFEDAPLLANGNSILLDGDFDLGAADETAMVNAYAAGSVVSRIEVFFTQTDRFHAARSFSRRRSTGLSWVCLTTSSIASRQTA